MISSWFIHSLIAVFAIGGMNALYKVPSTKGHNKFSYSFLSFLVATLLSLIVFNKYIHFDFRTVMFGLMWGIMFAVLTMFQMELLKKLDTNVVFPVTSLSSHILVVIVGVYFFHDVISTFQSVGIVLTFIVLAFYNKVHKKITLQNGVFLIMVSVVLLSTSSKFIQKFGSITTEPRNFIFWQLFFATVSAFFILLISRRTPVSKDLFSKEVIVWAIVLGVFNFIGTSEIIKALSTGPFSLVYTINTFYILIASVIAWKFFGETLTRRKVFFMLIAIVTIIFVGLH